MCYAVTIQNIHFRFYIAPLMMYFLLHPARLSRSNPLPAIHLVSTQSQFGAFPYILLPLVMDFVFRVLGSGPLSDFSDYETRLKNFFARRYF